MQSEVYARAKSQTGYGYKKQNHEAKQPRLPITKVVEYSPQAMPMQSQQAEAKQPPWKIGTVRLALKSKHTK